MSRKNKRLANFTDELQQISPSMVSYKKVYQVSSKKQRPKRQKLIAEALDPIPHTRKKVEIKHLTKSQSEYSKKIIENNIIIASGAAGTGKTYLAALHAMKMFTEGEVDTIVICRPVVTAGGEAIGFLPGGINEKLDPYIKPILDAFKTYWSMRTIQDMVKDGRIEIAPLGFMRGRSFHRTCLLCDEGQNATPEQLLMLLTRLGEGSKIIVTGDVTQKDIRTSCLDIARTKLSGIKGIDFMEFKRTDVVRHPLVERILEMWEKTTVGLAKVEEDLGKLPHFIDH